MVNEELQVNILDKKKKRERDETLKEHIVN